MTSIERTAYPQFPRLMTARELHASRSRIDRLCRRRDVPLREKTLWRMLYESASRASAVFALNIEDLDLSDKQAADHRQGRRCHVDHLGTDTARLLPG